MRNQVARLGGANICLSGRGLTRPPRIAGVTVFDHGSGGAGRFVGGSGQRAPVPGLDFRLRNVSPGTDFHDHVMDDGEVSRYMGSMPPGAIHSGPGNRSTIVWE